MRKAYSTDLPDGQWHILQPLLPAAKPGGRPRIVDMREVVHTLFSQKRPGCPWDLLPPDLLPKSTVDDYGCQWRADGTWQKGLDALREAVRQQAGRHPAPRAGRLASQTVQGTAVGGARGDDGNTKVHGRQRPRIVDTLGLLLAILVTAAAADDGTPAPQVLVKLDAQTHPRLALLGADQQYNHQTLQGWLARQQVGDTTEVVERPVGTKGFVQQFPLVM